MFEVLNVLDLLSLSWTCWKQTSCKAKDIGRGNADGVGSCKWKPSWQWKLQTWVKNTIWLHDNFGHYPLSILSQTCLKDFLFEIKVTTYMAPKKQRCQCWHKILNSGHYQINVLYLTPVDTSPIYSVDQVCDSTYFSHHWLGHQPSVRVGPERHK